MIFSASCVYLRFCAAFCTLHSETAVIYCKRSYSALPTYRFVATERPWTQPSWLQNSEQKVYQAKPLDTWHNSIVDSLPKSVGFGLKRSSKGQGHMVILSNFWHPFDICGTNADTKFKSITGCYCLRIQNYAGMRLVSEKNSPPTYIIVYYRMKTWNGISVTLHTTFGPPHHTLAR